MNLNPELAAKCQAVDGPLLKAGKGITHFNITIGEKHERYSMQPSEVLVLANREAVNQLQQWHEDPQTGKQAVEDLARDVFVKEQSLSKQEGPLLDRQRLWLGILEEANMVVTPDGVTPSQAYLVEHLKSVEERYRSGVTAT